MSGDYDVASVDSGVCVFVGEWVDGVEHVMGEEGSVVGEGE